VSGKTKTENLSSTYVRPAKITKERVINEVSQYRLIQQINNLLVSVKIEQANNDFAKLERLEKRAIDFKKAGLWQYLIKVGMTKFGII
jgi:hypothetical protein